MTSPSSDHAAHAERRRAWEAVRELNRRWALVLAELRTQAPYAATVVRVVRAYAALERASAYALRRAEEAGLRAVPLAASAVPELAPTRALTRRWAVTASWGAARRAEDALVVRWRGHDHAALADALEAAATAHEILAADIARELDRARFRRGLRHEVLTP
jgi:hypothetical protein